MQLPDLYRAAASRALATGREITLDDTWEQLLLLPGAREAIANVGERKAHAHIRRELSRVLKDFEVQALTEPEAERLFDDAEYRPPRAITMRRPDGSMVHKAIEFMSDADAPRYVAVLEDNIRAATRRRQEFVVWLDTVLPFFEPGGTLLGALRERRRHARRAA